MKVTELDGRLAGRVRYWDAWCLSFYNEEWEEVFSSYCNVQLSPGCIFGFVTMVYMSVIIKSRSSLSQSLQFMSLLILVCWGIAPVALSKLREWKGYSQRLWDLLNILWKCSLSLYVLLVAFQSGEGRSMQIDDMLIRASLLLFTMSICNRLTFKNVFMYHTISSMVSFAWSVRSCEYFANATKFAPTLDFQTKTIGFFYSAVLLGVGFPVQLWENPVSTSAVTAFLNVVCSWIVPLFIIYTRELRSRKGFLRCRVPQNNIVNMEQNAIDCHRAAICTAVLTSFVVLGSLDLLMK